MDTLENHKILIIDDLADNLKVMVSIFEEYHPNYEVFQTSDSRNAIEIAIKTLPDLIITDWEMPLLDGVDLIKKLKGEPKTSNIPIIIATGVMNTSNDLQKAFMSGAVDFVKKPIDPIELIARTNSAIKIAQEQNKKIRTKNNELAEGALYLVKNREFIIELSKKLQCLNNLFQEKGIKHNELLNEIIDLVNSKSSDDSMERFNIAFYSVHENFFRNLNAKFSNLTNIDLKLCAFLRLGMNSKDIASVLYHSVESVKVSRSRLRKKLKLDQSKNLQVFLSSI